MLVGGWIGVLIAIVVLCLVAYLLYWLIAYINPPEPIKKTAVVILVIIFILILISVFFGVAPSRLR